MDFDLTEASYTHLSTTQHGDDFVWWFFGMYENSEMGRIKDEGSERLGADMSV
jgi:hypothetical protein